MLHPSRGRARAGGGVVSLSGHQSPVMRSDTWLTPPEIISSLGEFDLDPCAAPSPRPWPTAKRHIELPEDGLRAEWAGRVWCNPPFGRAASAWLARMASHGNGIALIPARTETEMFFRSVWGAADAVLFLRGRPHFHRPCGARASFNSGAPICLVAYGVANVAAMERSGLGQIVPVIRNNRIRARLTPDRERVARAIAQSNQAGSDNGWQMFLPDADAAIAAIGETK